MTGPAERFARSYRDALAEHVAAGGEPGLAAAYGLGRWALDASLGLVEVVDVHQRAARELKLDGSATVAADQFLLQSVAAFDMAQRGFREAQERVRFEEELVSRLRAVTDGSIAIIGRFPSKDRLSEFLDQARKVVGAEHGAVWVDDGPHPEVATTEVTEPLLELMTEVVRTARPSRLSRRTDSRMAALGVPLVVPGGGVQGAIVVWDSEEFDAAAEAALGQLANIASIAWDNARLFEREHQISVTLQHSLLPEALPSVPGVALAARYVPAGPGTEVGGDWYDVIELDHARIGFVIGDVGGHGIRAASVMGQLRLALRAYSIDGYSPVDVVERVDRLLERLDPTQIATMIYAVLDPASNKLGIVNAGHPEPLLLDPEGRPRFVDAGTSVALGVAVNLIPPREESTEVTPGSSLLLYTDGLIESRGRPIDEGMDRLASTVADFEGSPDDLCDLVLSGIGESLDDDVCVMAISIASEA